MPHWSELPPSDQIFTHFDEATGKERTFAASALRRLCAREESEQAGVMYAWIELQGEHVEVLRAKRGLEEPRLLRALATPRYAPLLFCIMPDETHLLVDGSHTYVAMWMRGAREARAYIVPECLWRGALVTGLDKTTPEELLASHSSDGRVSAETWLREVLK